MKTIHTSDWHLGHELYSYDRSDEQRDFLRQLAAIVAAEQPDALVVSGDIFHTSTPSNSVMALFAEELDNIRRQCPGMTVVVAAGNHDSGSRLDAIKAPWRYLGVEIIGRIARDESTRRPDLSRHVVTVGPASAPKGLVVALPHVFMRGWPAIDETPGDSGEQRARFIAALNDAIALRAAELPGGADLPVVGIAHLALTSSDTTGHDLVGGMEFVDLDDFPLACDYLALGHIHKPQTFRRADGSLARYCGTPLGVSFAEVADHSVTIVETDARGTHPRIRTAPIVAPCPLVTIPADGAAYTFDEAIDALAAYPGRYYLRVRVAINDVPPAAANERAAKAASSGKGLFCKIDWIRPASASAPAEAMTPVDVEEFRAISPVEIAGRFYASRYEGKEFPDDLRQLFEEICDAVTAANSDPTDPEP